MALLGFARAGPVRAETITYLVTVLDTSAYSGTTGALDFQLNALGPGASDTVAITNFSGGVPGSVNFTAGDVSGSLSSLPLSITDDQINNEQNQAFTYGSSIPFLMTLATFSGTPGASFFFTMYDQNSTPIDAGPNGLSAVEIDADTGTGSQEPALVGPNVTVQILGAAVPEPSSGLLLSMGWLGVVVGSVVRKCHRRLTSARRDAAVHSG